MSRYKYLIFILSAMIVTACADGITKDTNLQYVNPFMGTGGDGCIVPAAAVPFGMVQLAADTRLTGSGYHYYNDRILGFSHVHKSGGGCTDFQDIMFMPVSCDQWQQATQYPDDVSSAFSHEREFASPGYYSVTLDDSGIFAELTATERCGVHRYKYKDGSAKQLVIDLKHGNIQNCTIFPEDNFDTVQMSQLRVINDRTIEGYRLSNGWVKKQYVYFYTEFSEPFKVALYRDKHLVVGESEVEGIDVRAILSFDKSSFDKITARTGISPVSIEGAKDNLMTEVKTWDFDQVKKSAEGKWGDLLGMIQIKDADSPQKRTFYTCLYNAMFYPMTYSDVNGDYRGPDREIRKAEGFRYLNGVTGLWDTFRAQVPLVTILQPQVMSEFIQTLYAHYQISGQLPIWVLGGEEVCGMIGYNSMPVIADAYNKGIRGFDAEKLFEAMKKSSNNDIFGYYLRDMRGAINYKAYGYVPCDMEMTSVSKTLEYAYDDWCIAQMAKMLGKESDYKEYIDRANNYKNLFDTQTNFMRGRKADGSWRTPFNPFLSNHYRAGDDFCEGTSWQWSFFAPHDGKGLMELYGGKDAFIAKLDSLFTVSSKIDGDNPAPDITGLIGQYAHGNEPSHSTAYMYVYAGQPWKTQQCVNKVVYDFYSTAPDGICGNDDTGQMSAWYVLSSMGFYPVTHGNGVYFLGTPIFGELALKHTAGVLTIKAANVSRKNMYIQSLKVNGKEYNKSWITHQELFGGDTLLEFEMAATPNKTWGADDSSLPPSMSDERFNKL